MLSSRKRILVISNTPFYGGGESFVASILDKVDAQMYYLIGCDQLMKYLPAEHSEFLSSTNKLAQLAQIKRKIKTIDPDIIIFNGGSTIFFVPFIRSKRKVIYKHTTNEAISGSLLKRIIYILAQQICFLFVSNVIHVSRYSLNEQKLNRKRASFVHHGLTPLDYSAKEMCDPIKFLFVGRTEKQKGIDIIIDTFSSMSNLNVELHIVGTGDMSDFISNLKHPNIIYHGFSTDVGYYYDSCDVFITLPYFEAFGLTIIEAMNHSMPVISCNTGAIPEIIEDGVNGIIIERNKESLIMAVQDLTANKARIREMGEMANSSIFQRFSLNKTISQIEQILDR